MPADSQMNGDACEVTTEPIQVKVNQRALVDKVLSRYPEEFTVFRELLQNADDARADSVEIEFQSRDYALHSSQGETKTKTNGLHTDLSAIQISKWIVRNNGDPFERKDWDRLARIADGNPDEQKIGAFGVGFFSVFSVTECPVIISGSFRKRMYYDTEDQLMIESKPCDATKWTTIEMELKDEGDLPKPFDLSRFLTSAVTFLVSIREVKISLNGTLLAEINKSRGNPEALPLPKDLKRTTPFRSLAVKSIQMIPQQVEVVLTGLAYTAGSKTNTIVPNLTEPQPSNPAKRATFFGKKAKADAAEVVQVNRSMSTVVSTVNYKIYSAVIAFNDLRKDIVAGVEAATKKKPPAEFLCEAVHFTMEEYEHVKRDGSKPGDLGSVFRGVQGLCGEPHGTHGARLFIGQSTAQTSGIAVHVSSRFIPTVERGTVDLANGQVQKWNEELIWVGGFMARFIYEQAMDAIRVKWPSQRSPLMEQLRREGLYIMRCFTFHKSTPDLKVAELLKKAFFDCSTSPSFPIVSNMGIRDSKDVREPHDEFATFMKDRPILDRSLWPTQSTMIPDLPDRYKVTAYTGRDVKEELNGRTFTEEEMIAFLTWWTRLYDHTPDPYDKWKHEFLAVGKFHSSLRTSPRVIWLRDIKKFVGGLGGILIPADPLPPDTIPMNLTRFLDAKSIQSSLDWQEMTVVDWIRHLTSTGLDPAHDIRTSLPFVEKVFSVLARWWPTMSPSLQKDVVVLLGDVPCIPTSKGMRKPQEAYFNDADIFNDLPVTQFSLSPDVDMYAPVLDDLGVNRFLDWDHIRARLQELDQFSPFRLVTYVTYARQFMEQGVFKEVLQMAIFPSTHGKRCCLHELYRPDVPQYRVLGLPQLSWHDFPPFASGIDTALELLRELGLQQTPPLQVIIEKASGTDQSVRSAAFNYLLNNLDDAYASYHPDQFAEYAFLPYGKGRQPQLGTPEQVFTTVEWELLGFKKLHQSVSAKNAIRLKVKDRPSAATLIKLLRENPPKDGATARRWFELLARKGGFNSEEISTLSELDIVPVREPGSTTYKFVAPSKCYLGQPDESKMHHRLLFRYVKFGEIADRFLKTCGAKANPDCADIVDALLEDARGYLDKAQDHKRYVDDLRQVATGYHTLPADIKIRMSQAPIFIAYRKKPRDASDPTQADTLQYMLRCAQEILVGDDMESLRLFGDRVYTAPKEEVFENFYREMGSESLSSHVRHIVNYRGALDNKASEAQNMRSLVMQRIAIFLHDQDGSRRSDVSHVEWKKEGKFTVRYCRHLEISKELLFDHAVTHDETKSLVPIREPALAGVETTPQGNYVLWMKHQPPEARRDWYDVSVALCRLLFKTHKTHDTLLLMTILDAQIDDLRRRGYDVDAIQRNYDKQVELAEEAKKEEETTKQNGVAPPHRPPRPIFGLPERLRDFMKRRSEGQSGNFLPGAMVDLVKDAIESCQSDANENRMINEDREKAKGGKKQRDVKYCSAARQTDLVRCAAKTKNGIMVYKTPESSDPPPAELEAFSGILLELGGLFDLQADKLHIFWQERYGRGKEKGTESAVELMGFNRNNAIYLNLAHYVGKHHCLPQDDASKATTYAAWYFIIAHEIAHNKAFFHDEDHELLFSALAQSRLTRFRAHLAKKAPGAK